MPTVGALQAVTESLVSRARAGDQNAMGMLATLGAESRKPYASLRTLVSARMVEQAIKKGRPGSFGDDAKPNPPRSLFEHAREPTAFVMVVRECGKFRRAFPALVALLANGPRLMTDRMRAYCAGLGPSPVGLACEKVVLRAQAIQRVRETTAPISLLSSEAAWELEP